MSRSLLKAIISSALLGISLAASADEKVSLYLKWIPQYQFAGYLVAQAKGYYRSEHLKVKIIPGGPDINTVQEVADGAAQFGIQTPEPIFYAYEHGLHLEMLMADFQEPYEEFMVKKNSKITSIKDFKGKTIGINIGGLSQLLLPVMLKNAGVAPSSVHTIRKTLSLAPFLYGRVPIWNGYVGNEPFESLDNGVPVREFTLAKYVPNWYGDTLFAKHSFVEKHDKLVKRFVQASQKGWQFSEEHPKETIRIIKKFNQQKTTKQLLQEASAVLPLLVSRHAPTDCFGRFQAGRVTDMENTMVHLVNWPAGKAVPSPHYFYTNKFLLCRNIK